MLVIHATFKFFETETSTVSLLKNFVEVLVLKCLTKFPPSNHRLFTKCYRTI